MKRCEWSVNKKAPKPFANFGGEYQGKGKGIIRKNFIILSMQPIVALFYYELIWIIYSSSHLHIYRWIHKIDISLVQFLP